MPLLVFVSFCTVQKRHYKKGYFISWKSPGRSIKAHNNKTAPSQAEKLVTADAHSRQDKQEAGLMPAAAVKPLELPEKKGSQPRLPGDSCDVILFKDGSEINAMILEINQAQVKYKRCDMPDGPTYSESKSKIFMLKYKNGVREVIHAESPSPQVSSPEPRGYAYNPKRRPNTKLATMAFVFSILGFYPLFFVGGLAAIIMSVIHLNNIATHPDEFGGEKKARTAMILGIISILTSVLIIALILI